MRGDTTSQDGQESLLWDSAAQNLEDPFDHKCLWSSLTTSTHFDVTVVKSESLTKDMATAGLQISEEDLRDAGPSGLQVEKNHVPAGSSNAVGGSVDTVSLVSTDTIVHRNLPTPAPRTSRRNTPVVGGLNARPHTPLLERRVVPPVVSPRRFLQAQEDHPEMSIWTQRVDRILMDAEDQVLLYHGVKLPPSELTAVRTEAQRLTAKLRDCHPHCSPEKQQEIAATRKAITVVLAQMAEAGHDVELEASSRGSVSSGPSGRSTPLDRYLAAIHNMENPQQAYGGARPRVPVGGLLTQQINLPPPEGASSFQGHPPPDPPPAAEHNHQAGGGNKQHAQPLAPPRGANTDQGQHPMGHQIGGVVAVTVVAVTATIAVITAVVMIDHTLPPLLPSSSRGRMLCFCWDLSRRKSSRTLDQVCFLTPNCSRSYMRSASLRSKVRSGIAMMQLANTRQEGGATLCS